MELKLNGNDDERQLPEEVGERLRWWAQLHGKTEADAQTEYVHYLSDNLAAGGRLFPHRSGGELCR